MNNKTNIDNSLSMETHLRLLAERSMLDRFNLTYGRDHRRVLVHRLLLLVLTGGLVLAVAVNHIGFSQPVSGSIDSDASVAMIDQMVNR